MSSIPTTRRKLEEAKFFLRHMQAETRRPLSRDPRASDEREVFGYFLSAFMTAARSVPWVFQAEDRPLYDRVQPEWDATLSEVDRVLLKFMNERRLDEVHRTGAALGHETMLVATTLTTPTGGAPHFAMIQILWAAEGGPTPRVPVLAPKFAVPGGAPIDVIPTCETHVNMLRRVGPLGRTSKESLARGLAVVGMREHGLVRPYCSSVTGYL